jgi:hypothetical protein
MVRVYFEKGNHADLIAAFMDEYTYKDCVPALERLCKDLGYDRMTESIEYSLMSQQLVTEIQRL